MSWTAAVSDIRTHINDGATDKLRYRKKVFGNADSSNLVFKTFEFRRITDFSTGSSGGFGVYVNGVLQTVTADATELGEFTLTVAPNNTAKIEATYYIQWFLDSELQHFLGAGNAWLGGLETDYASVTDGLRPAVLDYAAHLAYQKLSLKYAEHMSESFRLEDSMDPKKTEVVTAYQAASKTFLESAVEKRKSYYSRQDQWEAPLFGTSVGNVPAIVPRR